MRFVALRDIGEREVSGSISYYNSNRVRVTYRSDRIRVSLAVVIAFMVWISFCKDLKRHK